MPADRDGPVISPSEVREALARRGLRPEHRVVFDVCQSTASLVLAVLCARVVPRMWAHASFFAKDTPRAGVLSYVNMMAHHDVAQQYSMIKGARHRDAGELDKTYTAYLMAFVGRKYANVVVRSAVKETRLYHAVNAMRQKHVDLLALRSVTLMPSSATRKHVRIITLDDFDEERINATAAVLGVPINVPPMRIDTYAVQLWTNEMLHQPVANILTAEDRARMYRMLDHVTVHGRTLQRLVWEAIRRHVLIDAAHHFAVVTGSSDWLDHEVVAVSFLRSLLSWGTARTVRIGDSTQVALLQAIRNGRRSFFAQEMYFIKMQSARADEPPKWIMYTDPQAVEPPVELYMRGRARLRWMWYNIKPRRAGFERKPTDVDRRPPPVLRVGSATSAATVPANVRQHPLLLAALERLPPYVRHHVPVVYMQSVASGRRRQGAEAISIGGGWRKPDTRTEQQEVVEYDFVAAPTLDVYADRAAYRRYIESFRFPFGIGFYVAYKLGLDPYIPGLALPPLCPVQPDAPVAFADLEPDARPDADADVDAGLAAADGELFEGDDAQ